MEKWDNNKISEKTTRYRRFAAAFYDYMIDLTIIWFIYNVIVAFTKWQTFWFNLAWIKFVPNSWQALSWNQRFWRFIIYWPIGWVFFIILGYLLGLISEFLAFIGMIPFYCIVIFNIVERFFNSPTFFEKKLWIKKIQWKKANLGHFWIILWMTRLLTFIEDYVFGVPTGKLGHGELHQALIILRFCIATCLYLLIRWIIYLVKHKKFKLKWILLTIIWVTFICCCIALFKSHTNNDEWKNSIIEEYKIEDTEAMPLNNTQTSFDNNESIKEWSNKNSVKVENSNQISDFELFELNQKCNDKYKSLYIREKNWFHSAYHRDAYSEHTQSPTSYEYEIFYSPKLHNCIFAFKEEWLWCQQVVWSCERDDLLANNDFAQVKYVIEEIFSDTKQERLLFEDHCFEPSNPWVTFWWCGDSISLKKYKNWFRGLVYELRDEYENKISELKGF